MATGKRYSSTRMDICFIDIDAQQRDSLTAHIVQTHKMFKCTYECECLCLCVSKYNYTNIVEAGIDSGTNRTKLSTPWNFVKLGNCYENTYCYSLSLLL